MCFCQGAPEREPRASSGVFLWHEGAISSSIVSGEQRPWFPSGLSKKLQNTVRACGSPGLSYLPFFCKQRNCQNGNAFPLVLPSKGDNVNYSSFLFQKDRHSFSHWPMHFCPHQQLDLASTDVYFNFIIKEEC